MNTGEASGDAVFVLDEVASRKAIDSIRRAAVDGLFALPRVGMGVGGFLVGLRRDGKIQILNHLEIPCAHARGPGFILSPEEIEHARGLRAAAAPLEILGIYVSRTRGPLELANADLDLFRSLCPGPDEIAVVLRPSTVQPALAALFRKSPGDHITTCREWEIEPLHGEPSGPDVAAGEPPPANSSVHALKVAAAAAPPEPPAARPELSNGKPRTGMAEPAPAQSDARFIPEQAFAAGEPHDTRHRTKQAADPLGQPTPATPHRVARPAASKPPAESPVSGARARPGPETWRPHLHSPRHSVLFREPEQRGNSSRKLLYLLGAGALVAAVVVLMFRGQWVAVPNVSLDVADDHGTAVFRWNHEAVDGAGTGKLLVSDAGQLSEFPLDSARLAAGFFRYRPKSDGVVAKIIVGERSARAVYFRRPSTASEPATAPQPAPLTPATGPAQPDSTRAGAPAERE